MPRSAVRITVAIGALLTFLVLGRGTAWAAAVVPGDIAYESALDGVLRLAHADGTDFGSLGMNGTNPLWSPDGRSIACYDPDEANGGEYAALRVVDVTSGASFALAEGIDCSGGRFSWDMSGQNVLNRFDIAGEQTVPEFWSRVPAEPGGDASGVEILGDQTEFVEQLGTMPDGRLAAVLHPYELKFDARDSHYYRVFSPLQLVIMRDDGIVAKRASISTYGFKSLGRPRVSPDDSKVVFSASRSDTNSGIYLWDLKTDKVQLLFQGGTDYSEAPCFTPDGASVIWTRRAGSEWGSSDVWKMGSDGRGPQLLIADAACADSCPFSSSYYRPLPYGWSIENGVDTDRRDDWRVWMNVFGPFSWMSYFRSNGDSVAVGKGLFESGNCYGMAASSLANYLHGGDVSGFTWVCGQSPYAGLWSLLSLGTDRSGGSGYVRLTATTESQMRECIEGFQLIQGLIRARGDAASTAEEVARRLDAGDAPPVITIHDKGEGHALVPFAYSRVVPGRTDIYVYDCNWPGSTDRVLHVVDASGSWSYRLWSGEDWGGSGSTLNWYSPTDILDVSGGVRPQAVGAASSALLPISVQTVNARVLITDSSDRRVGYLGSDMVNEIPGAQPSYPDARGGVGFVSFFALPQVPVASVLLNPLAAAPTGVNLFDTDSVVSADVPGTPGTADRVLVNGALDSVSVAPGAGVVKTVSLWAGTSARSGSVMFGALDATTTAGDVVLSAVPNEARVENRSAGDKHMTLAAIGSGWIGRKSVPVTVPAGATIAISVSLPDSVTSSSLLVGVVSGPGVGVPTTASSAPYGQAHLALGPMPTTVPYMEPFTILANVAGDIGLSQVHLQVSTDARTWSDVGAFSGRDPQGRLTRSLSLAQDSYVRLTVPQDANHNESYSSSARVLLDESSTSITIKTNATSTYIGKTPILSGAVTPSAMIGRNIVVYVQKPGKSYWTYSSNRTVYSLNGSPSWQYKYYFKPGMAKGTYKFKAVAPAPGFASSVGFATSTSPTTVLIRVR
jgi:hypothetical protein